MNRLAFETAWTAFHDALRANDADAMFAHVAEDVLIMPPGEPVVRGKSAARAWFAGFLTQYRTVALTFTDREILVSHDSAIDIGSYQWELAPVAGGETVFDRGSYMQVWKLQPGGHWHFAREIWNSTVPPTAAQ